jgi:hypothetical protein
LGVKRPGREADHSPPSSAEVKNAWSYTSILQYAFMAWCLGTGTTLPLPLPLYYEYRSKMKSMRRKCYTGGICVRRSLKSLLLLIAEKPITSYVNGGGRNLMNLPLTVM